MFEEPEEPSQDRKFDPKQRAKDKTDEFRVHAEVCAVFEGPRKYDAQILRIDDQTARDIQKRIAKLEKSKSQESPILPAESMAEAAAILKIPSQGALSTNDYHISRRPGEVMILRWLEGPQVESFYERIQAHFDVALDDFKNEQREAYGWKQDSKMTAFLEALDGVEMKMADRYLRDVIRKHNVFVLSTLTADEMDISFIAETVMGAQVSDVVGAAAELPDDPSESDRAWFFKLFSLRGIVEGVERMCFFAFLQKAEESW